jgi:hypothetical protein
MYVVTYKEHKLSSDEQDSKRKLPSYGERARDDSKDCVEGPEDDSGESRDADQSDSVSSLCGENRKQ